MSDSKPTPSRPVPNLKELDTHAFWSATAEEKLTYQVCGDCGAIVFYPRAHCTSCMSSNLELREASGLGTVYTFSIVRQSYHPFFRTVAPYAVAWIDLDEGPRLLSNVVNIPVDELNIGQRVQVLWETHEALKIPLFEPLRG